MLSSISSQTCICAHSNTCVLTHTHAWTGNAAKTGRSTEVNQVLKGVRDVLQLQRARVREAFDSLDTDRDGCLPLLDVVRLVRMLVQGACKMCVCVCCVCVTRAAPARAPFPACKAARSTQQDMCTQRCFHQIRTNQKAITTSSYHNLELGRYATPRANNPFYCRVRPAGAGRISVRRAHLHAFVSAALGEDIYLLSWGCISGVRVASTQHVCTLDNWSSLSPDPGFSLTLLFRRVLPLR